MGEISERYSRRVAHVPGSATCSTLRKRDSATMAATGATSTYEAGEPAPAPTGAASGVLKMIRNSVLGSWFAGSTPEPAAPAPAKASSPPTLSQRRQQTTVKIEPPTTNPEAAPKTMSKTCDSSKLTVTVRAIRLSVVNIAERVMHPNISYGWWAIAMILLVFAIMVETDNAGDYSHIEAFENMLGFGNHYWWKWHHLSMN